MHRDLKPANLFITRDGIVKVLDFGIARIREAVTSGVGALTQTGALLGTPAFLPPEQAGGRPEHIGPQTDIWALGATMFTLLTGQYVHDAPNATQIIIAAATQPSRSLYTAMPHAPAALAHLIDTALAFDPARRWPSTHAMRDANREVYRALTGRAPTREVIAESFGIGTWETKVAEVLGSDPVANPITGPGISAPGMTPGFAARGATAPMPASGLGFGATTRPQVSTVATATSPPRKNATMYVIGIVSALVGFVAIGATLVLMKHRTATTPSPKEGASEQPTTRATLETHPTSSTLEALPSATIEASAVTTTHAAAPPVASVHTKSSAAPSATTPAVTYTTTPTCHYVESFDKDGEKHVHKVCP